MVNEENLKALGAQAMKSSEVPAPRPGGKRCLRVRVLDSNGAKKVNVNIPLGLVKAATKFMAFLPKEAQSEMSRKGIDLSQIDFDELVRLVDEGVSDGRLVDVDVDDPREGRIKVEVYVN